MTAEYIIDVGFSLVEVHVVEKIVHDVEAVVILINYNGDEFYSYRCRNGMYTPPVYMTADLRSKLAHE